MPRVLNRVASGLCILLSGMPGQSARAQPQHTWRADVQVRTLEVTKTKKTMSARVVIYTENDDDARDACLVFLLPVGVGIERLGIGCAATSGPSNVPSLRAAVACELGAIPNRGVREVWITTTLPSAGLPKRFGVFAYSATPDPVPGNNYAERTIP
jgi:hypothetical protein